MGVRPSDCVGLGMRRDYSVARLVDKAVLRSKVRVEVFMRLLIQVVVIGMMMATVASAKETPPSDELNAQQAQAAAELRLQDRMFGLLMAAYFEVQQDQIERDYERRLRIGAGEGNDNTGLVVYSPMKIESQLPSAYRMLIHKERELRLARMARNVTDLLDLYQSRRVGDQKEIGMSIPSAVDMETAMKEVKKLLAARMERPRDPRQWAEHSSDTMQSASLEQEKEQPALEVMLQRVLEAEKKAAAARIEQQRPGLMESILFGLPMLRIPSAMRP